MSVADPDPMPVIVGAPRSGTTLLRLMLDAHPQLAIPPETGWLPAAATLAAANADAAALQALIVGFPPEAPAWADFGMSAADLAAALAEVRPFTVPAGVRAFYRRYAARFGKPRWGDKTPVHGLALPAIAGLLPEARFIHLVRDGRDVAVSLRERWFAPGRDGGSLGKFWDERVRAIRAAAAAVPHALEIRFEALVAAPEAELRRLCAFLALPFDPAMLRHADRAAERLAEHQERRRADGGLLIDRDARLRQQAKSAEAPDRARVGVWRTALAADDVAAFHAAAGPLLAELGYPAA